MAAGRSPETGSIDGVDDRQRGPSVAPTSGKLAGKGEGPQEKRPLVCMECGCERPNLRKMYWHLVEAHGFDNERAYHDAGVTMETMMLQKAASEKAPPKGYIPPSLQEP